MEETAIEIVELPVPASADVPLDALYEGYAAVFDADQLDLTGGNDLSLSAKQRQAAAVPSTRAKSHRWLAFPTGKRGPEDAVGAAAVQMPLTEDKDIVEASIVVHPEHRGRGIGSALAAVVEERLRQIGRKTIQVTSEHLPYEGADALVPPNGQGAINPHDVSGKWLQRLGFKLEQAYKRSVWTLPSAEDPHWQELTLSVLNRAKNGSYRLVQWQGPTPPEFQDGMAALFEGMSQDEPTAGMEHDAQVWDAGRVQERDRLDADTGWDKVTTAVLHEPSAELVAFSLLEWPQGPSVWVGQEDTFVAREHRGNGLGLLTKVGNVNLLRQANPAAKRIHTWNADENQHMLAINHALGFRPLTVTGEWQLRL